MHDPFQGFPKDDPKSHNIEGELQHSHLHNSMELTAYPLYYITRQPTQEDLPL